jgi:hypothetical protein
MESSKNLDIAMNFIGWGDPHKSVWFFGLEEGAKFNQEYINEIDGKALVALAGEENLNWPVANKTARIMADLVGYSDSESYRDKVLWRAGSGSFNGNLLPLGKASRNQWADEYEHLFGLSDNQLDHYMELVKSLRYPKIKQLRERSEPQAIICFGKECWSEFEHVFVEHPDEMEKYEEEKIKVFPQDRVMLCGHFSYGVHFSNKALARVVEILKRWGVHPEKRNQ